MTKDEQQRYDACVTAWTERVRCLRSLAPSNPQKASEWLACAQEIARCLSDLTGLPASELGLE